MDSADADDPDVEFGPPKCTDMEQMEFQTDYNLQWIALTSSGKSPFCIREDGFGGTAPHCGSSEPIEEFYYHCDDPVTSTSDDVEITRQTPCTWWPQLAEDEEGNCFHDFVCVPQDRLPEIGWPEGSDFDFYDECRDNSDPGPGPQPPSGG